MIAETRWNARYLLPIRDWTARAVRGYHTREHVGDNRELRNSMTFDACALRKMSRSGASCRKMWVAAPQQVTWVRQGHTTEHAVKSEESKPIQRNDSSQAHGTATEIATRSE
jgi:hypothetical protein